MFNSPEAITSRPIATAPRVCYATFAIFMVANVARKRDRWVCSAFDLVTRGLPANPCEGHEHPQVHPHLRHISYFISAGQGHLAVCRIDEETFRNSALPFRAQNSLKAWTSGRCCGRTDRRRSLFASYCELDVGLRGQFQAARWHVQTLFEIQGSFWTRLPARLTTS